MDEWPAVDSRVEYENPFFTAGYDAVERPDGEEARYYWTDPADGVVVVAHDRIADDLVLAEQYRPRQRRRLLECPGGAVDAGESPTEAGVRELAEETGYRAGRAELLTSYHPSGWTRQVRHVVYATDLARGDRNPDGAELDLTVHRRPVAEAVERAREPPAVGWLLTPLLVARGAGLL